MCDDSNGVVNLLIDLILSDDKEEKERLKEKIKQSVYAGTRTEERRFKDVVETVLKNIGIPRSLTGYTYCTEAIVYLNSNPNATICKEVYTHISDIHCVSANSVERCIRSAADVATNRCSDELFYKIFGSTAGKLTARPTNKAFLYNLLYYVKSITDR